MFGRKRKDRFEYMELEEPKVIGTKMTDKERLDWQSGERRIWVLAKELAKETHVLIAGTSGSGKSVLLNSMIWSFLPSRVMNVFIDLKRVELSKYQNHPRTFAVVKEPEDVLPRLDWLIAEMNQRYKIMESKGQVHTDYAPIYVWIDELAELLNIKGVEDRLATLMRLGRASEIHLIMATQSPNRKVITAKLQQNLSCAIALRCRSAIESRQIIGIAGAEKLPRYGRGIMWNSEGIKEIVIPMTSDEDIMNRITLGI